MIHVKRGIQGGVLRRALLCYRLSRFYQAEICFYQTTLDRKPSAKVTTVALGSDRAAKIMAVRASIARVAAIDSSWAEATVVARAVETTVPAMPLNDWELMQGARERALAVRDKLNAQRRDADIYVGLEGGFHSISIEGEWHTFLRGWAYATDGKNGSFGAAPSISVPARWQKSY